MASSAAAPSAHAGSGASTSQSSSFAFGGKVIVLEAPAVRAAAEASIWASAGSVPFSIASTNIAVSTQSGTGKSISHSSSISEETGGKVVRASASPLARCVAPISIAASSGELSVASRALSSALSQRLLNCEVAAHGRRPTCAGPTGLDCSRAMIWATRHSQPSAEARTHR
eukprot:6182362-Pleurochrysis_carterae.AAC.1